MLEGEAVGLWTVAELRPALGDHDQELPALAAKVTDPPAQKVVGPWGVIEAAVETVSSSLTSSMRYCCVEESFENLTLKLEVAGIVPLAVTRYQVL